MAIVGAVIVLNVRFRVYLILALRSQMWQNSILLSQLLFSTNTLLEKFAKMVNATNSQQGLISTTRKMPCCIKADMDMPKMTQHITTKARNIDCKVIEKNRNKKTIGKMTQFTSDSKISQLCFSYNIYEKSWAYIANSSSSLQTRFHSSLILF